MGRKIKANTPYPIHLAKVIGPPPRTLILPSGLGVSNNPVIAKKHNNKTNPINIKNRLLISW